MNFVKIKRGYRLIKPPHKYLRFCGDPGGFDSGVLNSAIDKRGFAPFETPKKVSVASHRVKNYL
jgi:hypothetical protein